MIAKKELDEEKRLESVFARSKEIMGRLYQGTGGVPLGFSDLLKSDAIWKSIGHYRNLRLNKKDWEPGDKIPYSGWVYDEIEIRNQIDCVLNYWLTEGKYCAEFSKGLETYLSGRSHSVFNVHLCNSGSSANLLAFAALTSKQLGDRRIKPGDEVITVAACFPTTVAPLVQVGAVPVFVDVTLPGYNIDFTKLEAARSSKTKAVILAHTLGNPFDIAEVQTFCDKHDLWLIEDNCDALGSEFDIYKTGSFGDLSTISFFPSHHITTGEGGAVCTHNDELSQIVASFRDWGRDCTCKPGQDGRCGLRHSGQYGQLPHGFDHKYVYSELGFNLKMTEMQAAIGCAQIEKLPEFVIKRRNNWEKLRNRIFNKNLIMPEPTECSDPSWFGFLMTVKPDSELTRFEIVDHLEKKGIQTRMLFSGNIIKQPCFEGVAFRSVGDLPNTDLIMKNSFWVGVYPGLTEPMLDYMIKTINEV